MNACTIYILLPIFNEGKSLNSLLDKISKIMQENAYNYKIVAVNDGSSDNSLDILEKYAQRYPIEIVHHKYNRGLDETIRDGLERIAELGSEQDIAIRMDSDDTHEPEYIPAMVERLDTGYDVVIASRFQVGGGQEGLNSYRRFISRCANIYMKIFFPIRGVKDYSCGFRAYRLDLLKRALDIFGNKFIDLRGVGFTCTVEKLLKFRMMRAKIAEVPFKLRYNQKKSSSKMLGNITTLGYLILTVKYIYPWGKITKDWLCQINKRKAKR